MLFPIGQLTNSIALLLLIQLNTTKEYYVLKFTRQPWLSAHLGDGMAHFGVSVVILVLLLRAIVVLEPTIQKCDCLASTSPIGNIKSL